MQFVMMSKKKKKKGRVQWNILRQKNTNNLSNLGHSYKMKPRGNETMTTLLEARIIGTESSVLRKLAY